MIRVWNYSRSRVHSIRGIRHISISLDSKLIFIGEISKSSGDRSQLLEDAEYILFTGNKTILNLIEQKDWIDTFELEEPGQERGKSNDRNSARPFTGDKSPTRKSEKAISSAGVMDFNRLILKPQLPTEKHGTVRRAGQATISFLEMSLKSQGQNNLREEFPAKQIQKVKRCPSDSNVIERDEESPTSRSSAIDLIEIRIVSAWNGERTFALRAIELIGRKCFKEDSNQNKIKVGKEAIESTYETIQGNYSYLLSGDPTTKSEDFMWVASLSKKGSISIKLSRKVCVKQIIVYNYCFKAKSGLGVKEMTLKLGDFQPRTLFVNKCPEEVGPSYGHRISLSAVPRDHLRIAPYITSLSNNKHSVIYWLTQSFSVPLKSSGRFIRIRLLTNYGDKHYIGLNEIELYDSVLSPILAPRKVAYSLYCDPTMAHTGAVDEKRVPENLVNGITGGSDYDKHFLAPYINPKRLQERCNLGREFNQIFILFDETVDCIGMAFWNYSKSPARGVKDLEIFIDEQLVYAGAIKQVVDGKLKTIIPLSQVGEEAFSRKGQKFSGSKDDTEPPETLTKFTNEGFLIGNPDLKTPPSDDEQPSGHSLLQNTKEFFNKDSSATFKEDQEPPEPFFLREFSFD